MAVHDHSQHQEQSSGSFLASRMGLLFTEHRAHVLGALIYVPLLLCPLMHFFMHPGHGSHHQHENDGRSS